jgi:sigma-B regulation protein RsbU (phosphoserine phosphatase)
MNAVLETGVTPARVAAPTLVAMDRATVAFAAEMQNTLVPPLYYLGDSVEAHGQCIPKEQVGGDLMDLVVDGPEVIAYVADISGHGLRAGVLMAMIKTAIRYGLLLRRPLRGLFSDLNRLLPQVKEPSMFATLAALRFDGSKEVEYVSAGHVPLLHFRKKMNDVIGHYAQQFPLGLLAGDTYVSRRIHFEAGDIFLLPTDGAVELGEERDAEAGLGVLAQTLCKFNEHPLAEILEILRDEISRHGAEHDDRTVLLVRTLSRSGNHEELGRQRQPHDTTCREVLEATWHKMLAGLAAGLEDE